MEPAKLAIFLLFFVAFIVITRRMFSGGPSISPYAPPEAPPDGWQDYSGEQPAVIGAELPFPVRVPPLERLPDGRYNRPKVLNYYFSNLDLKRGPENPRSFCDQLFIQFEAPETGAQWTSEYIVATPFGLQALIDETGQNLAFDGTVIVVPRWDIAEILKTVLDDVIEKYAAPDDREASASDSSRRYWG
ncbi:MAG TPA: hypothetical protein VI685_26745 [Candidatus Angelobacter sp.]